MWTKSTEVYKSLETREKLGYQYTFRISWAKMAVPLGIHRLKNYKIRGIDVERVRTKKEEEGMQLRKERRENQLSKRRNLDIVKKEDGVQTKDIPVKDGSDEFVNDNEKSHDDKSCDKKDLELNDDTPLDIVANIVIEGIGEKRLDAVKHMRRVLSQGNPPIDDVISTGVVPYLVECVNPEEPEALQMEAAWALTNIASGTSEQTKSVVESGGVPRFVQLLEAPNSDVREQVLWALGNITGDCPEYRDLIIDFGIIIPLSEMLGNDGETLKVRKQAAWLLSNLCRHKHSPLNSSTIDELLPVYIRAYETEDDDAILKDLSWGVSYLTEDGNLDRVQKVLDFGFLEPIIKLLIHQNREVVQSAVRFVGNITTGSDSQTQLIIDLGGLPKLKSLLSHEHFSLQRESCWAISNITAGTIEQKQAVIDGDIVPDLMDILSSDASFRLKKEAVWAVSNITENATFEQISYLVGMGTLQSLCDALTIPDNEIIRVSLDGILGILEAGSKQDGCNPFARMINESDNLLSQIEQLQQHENQDIYQKSILILDKFSLEEDDVDKEEVEPENDSNNEQRNKNL